MVRRTLVVTLMTLLATSCVRTIQTDDAGRECPSATRVLGEGDSIPGTCEIQMFDSSLLTTIESARSGRPMVLNFWASWCTYCIKEMPDFQRVFEGNRDSIAFLGVNLLNVQGETRSEARRLADQTGVRYPLAFDQNGQLYKHFSLRTLMPLTVLVRADGTIATTHFGPLDAKGLKEAIVDYLKLGDAMRGDSGVKVTINQVGERRKRPFS